MSALSRDKLGTDVPLILTIFLCPRDPIFSSQTLMRPAERL
jgi:hypothetical protein